MVFPRVIYGSESRTIKKAEHQRIEELMLLNGGVGEDSWESLGLQPVHPKGNQPWIFIGRTDAEAETPTLWPPEERNWLVGKDPDVGKDWRQEEKGTTGWNGRMISLTWWTWVWASSGSLVMDREAWPAAVHGVTKSWTWLSDRTELMYYRRNSGPGHFCRNIYI